MAAVKFDRDAKLKYVALLAAGHMRREAARVLGVSWRTVADHMQADEEFREEVEEAEAQATETVEKVLFDRAKQGEPWAVKEWLAKRDKQRWGDKVDVDVTVSGTVDHTIKVDQAGIKELAARLERRRLELEPGDPDVIDVDPVD